MYKLFIISAVLCAVAFAKPEAKPKASPQFLGVDPYKYQHGVMPYNFGALDAYKHYPYNYDAAKYGVDPYSKLAGYQHPYSAYPYNYGIHGHPLQHDAYARAGVPYTAGLLNAAHPYSGIYNPANLYKY